MSRNARPRPEWSVAEAKARFSEVVARARAGEPQHVTRYGKDEVVVVSAAEWAQAKPQLDRVQNSDRVGSLLELFEPLRGSGLQLDERRGGLRESSAVFANAEPISLWEALAPWRGVVDEMSQETIEGIVRDRRPAQALDSSLVGD